MTCEPRLIFTTTPASALFAGTKKSAVSANEMIAVILEKVRILGLSTTNKFFATQIVRDHQRAQYPALIN
jgi:hypothetical protein